MRLVVSRGVLIASLCCVFLVVGMFTDPPGHLPDFTQDWHPAAVTAVGGAWFSLVWLLEHYPLAAAVAAVLCIPWLLSWLIGHLPRRIVKDPQRLFITAERRSASDMAGGRCEGEWFPFVRCRGPAEQGDHWFPWSLGGATSMDNLVMLCGPCNRGKSNHVPTFWQTQRLVMRRRKYFPPGRNPRPGARYGTVPGLRM